MRRTARGETLRSEEPAEESAVGGAAGRAPSELASGDHVEYLADMILELRSMAERTGAPTLAGIL